MGNNDLIEQAHKAAIVSALFKSGNQLLWPVEDEGKMERTSEQRLDFRGDKLYVYTPLGGGLYKEGLVMTKEIFQACYKKWIESEGKDDKLNGET